MTTVQCIVAVLIVGLVACNQKPRATNAKYTTDALEVSIDTMDTDNCSNISYGRIFALRMQANDEVFYEHFILLSEYDEQCFSQIDFSKVAQNYVDTCKINTPVDVVSFLKSNDGNGFEANEPDYDYIYQNKLIGFVMKSKKVSDIIIVNGKSEKIIKIENCEWEENSTSR